MLERGQWAMAVPRACKSTNGLEDEDEEDEMNVQWAWMVRDVKRLCYAMIVNSRRRGIMPGLGVTFLKIWISSSPLSFLTHSTWSLDSAI